MHEGVGTRRVSNTAVDWCAGVVRDPMEELSRPMLPTGDPSLFRLTVFCTVVDNRSFTRAAEKLLLSQPAVSVHVRALEQAFGVTLLDRSHREIVPTEAGEAVYAHARHVLLHTQETAELVAELRTGASGRVSLGASTNPGNYVLPSLLAEFWGAHPGARVRMRMATRRRVMEDVVAGALEFGYIEAGEVARGLTSEPMHAEHLVVVASPEHPLASLRPVAAAELLKEEIIFGILGSSYFADNVWHQLEALGLPIRRPALELGSPEAIKRTIVTSKGIGFLVNSCVARELGTGELVELRTSELQLRVTYQLVYRPRVYRAPVAAAFLRFLREKLSQRDDAPSSG